MIQTRVCWSGWSFAGTNMGKRVLLVTSMVLWQYPPDHNGSIVSSSRVVSKRGTEGSKHHPSLKGRPPEHCGFKVPGPNIEEFAVYSQPRWPRQIR